MKKELKIDEAFIRAHLPKETADQPIDFFHGMYLDGLSVMAEGERGREDRVIYKAENEEDLKYWQLETVCRFLKDRNPPERKKWRYERDHAENGQWLYTEHRHYDYNAIEDQRLCAFESFLRYLHFAFPEDRWEKKAEECVSLMNRWYEIPHWDYDRRNMCFIEISDSREHDRDDEIIEELRKGSVIRIIE